MVTDWNGKVITVCFSAGEKKFIYPDAFSEGNVFDWLSDQLHRVCSFLAEAP